ncbi:hypothetical protein [Salipaludibacillus agaradhaerens]|uniref:hypothetical protein n=1 Tax=Salipaludibacillus agaradhaerens TaxID=76935 RepID=UPI0009978248|nr:hypothetical protein [Salipaludibacillus agaradhaerens]
MTKLMRQLNTCLKNIWVMITLGVILILAGLTYLEVYLDNKESKDDENVRILNAYNTTVNNFYLDVAYYSNEPPLDVAFVKTGYTDEVLERWQLVSRYYADINYMAYPEEVVQENDWFAVNEFFTNSLAGLRRLYREDTEFQASTPNPDDIERFILTGNRGGINEDYQSEMGLE